MEEKVLHFVVQLGIKKMFDQYWSTRKVSWQQENNKNLILELIEVEKWLHLEDQSMQMQLQIVWQMKLGKANFRWIFS